MALHFSEFSGCPIKPWGGGWSLEREDRSLRLGPSCLVDFAARRPDGAWLVEELQADDSGDDMSVLLVGYGDQAFGQQMQATMEGIGRYLKIKTDIDTVGYAFCGELVDYSGEPIVEAIKELLQLEEEVLVVPVLLGVDEMLQTNTIEAAVNAIPTASRVRYAPTAVLPDPKVNEWLEKQVQAAVARAHGAGGDIIGEVKVPSEL